MRRSTCMLFVWGMLGAVLLVALPDAVQGQTVIAKSGSTSVRGVLERKTANVTIQTVTIEDSSNAFPSIDWRVKAITLVKTLQISVEGNMVFVPRSVFADLLDPKLASVRLEKGHFVLIITGADGAESYVVHVYFDMTRVKRRMLYSSLTPESLAEDTHYRLTVLKDQ